MNRRFLKPLSAQLLVALYAAYLLWSLLSSSPLPPGTLSPLVVMEVESALPPSMPRGLWFFHLAAAYVSKALGVSLASTLSILLVSFTALCALGGFALAWSMSRSSLASWMAGLVLLLTPFTYEALMQGALDLLASLAMSTLLLASAIHLLTKTNRLSALLIIIASMLFSTADPRLAIASTPMLMLLLYFMAKTRPAALAVLTSVTLVVVFYTASLGAEGVALAPLVIHVSQRNPLITALLTACAVMGGVLLYRDGRRRQLSLAAAWMIGVVAYAALLAEEAWVLATPVVACLAAIPFSRIQEAFTLTKRVEDGEEVYEVEVDPRWLLTSLAPLVLLCLLAFQGAFAIPHLHSQNALSLEEFRGLQEVASWINANADQGRVVAHPSIANWLAALTNGRAVKLTSLDDFKRLNALTSTTFRIATPHFIIDELEPGSASRAPSIYINAEASSPELLFIDDSKVRATLTSPAGEAWVESPFKARFTGYQWEEGEGYVKLRECFSTPNLEMEKDIVAYLHEPRLEVGYRLVARRDLTISSLSLPVFISGHQALLSYRVANGGALLKLSSGEVAVTYFNADEVSLGEQGGQCYVVATYRQPSRAVEARVEVKVARSTPMGHGAWRFSLMDLLSEAGARYIVVPRGLKHLEGLEVEEVLGVYIVDAYVRFLLVNGGRWVEAPAYAEVLSEGEGAGNGRAHEILYRTAGLLVDKTLIEGEGSLSITYEAKPWKPEHFLSSANLTIWVPWSRELVSCSVANSKATLVLDAGRIDLQFSPNLVDLEVHGLNSGQPHIKARFSLKPGGDAIYVNLSSCRYAGHVYEAAARPLMEGCDVVKVFLERGLLKPVYYTELYVVYEVTCLD